MHILESAVRRSYSKTFHLETFQGNSNIVALPSNLLVNIRPQTGAQGGQKPGVGQQRVVINQQMRPQNNTVSRAKLKLNLKF